MVMAPQLANSSASCTPPLSQSFIVILDGVSVLISIAILIVLTFMKRRVRCAPGCCNGRPGLPVPMDFLITPRHRWIYVAIFGVMAVSAFITFNQLNSGNSSENLYVNLVIKLICLPLLAIVMISLQFFPLFACVDASIPFLGHVMGFIYSLMWYTFVLASHSSSYIQDSLMCEDGHTTTDKISLCLSILKDAPYLIVCGCVVLWYCYHTVRGVIKLFRLLDHRRRGFVNIGTTGGHSEEEDTRSSLLCRYHQIAKVKSLLKRPVVSDHTGRVRNCLRRAWRYFVPFDTNFRLPLPFLGAVATMVMLLYQLSFTLGFLGISFANTLRILYTRHINRTGNVIADEILRSVFVGMPALLVLSPIVSTIVCVLMLLHMIGSISKVMKKVAQRGFTEELPGVLSRVPASWKFIGLQIGFFMCAWIIYYLVFILLGAIIAALYIFLSIPFTRTWTINTILGLLIPVIWARAIFYSQYLICKFLFFADKEGKFISITNQNLFNWFSFVLFFYNGLAGFIGAVFRVALSAVLSLIQLFRLDELSLMQKFAWLDFGHNAFLGFFYLDYAYNNAVVHVFIKILKESLEESLRTPSSSGSSDVEPGSRKIATTNFPPQNVYCPQRIRNRWLVAYTLIRNPSLQKLLASNLSRSAANNEEEKWYESGRFVEEKEEELIQIQGKLN